MNLKQNSFVSVIFGGKWIFFSGEKLIIFFHKNQAIYIIIYKWKFVSLKWCNRNFKISPAFENKKSVIMKTSRSAKETNSVITSVFQRPYAPRHCGTYCLHSQRRLMRSWNVIERFGTFLENQQSGHKYIKSQTVSPNSFHYYLSFVWHFFWKWFLSIVNDSLMKSNLAKIW